MLVELGGGTNPHPRADLVVDLHHPSPVGTPRQDATDTPWRMDHALAGADCYREDGERWWHLDDGSVDEVYCSHFLEHVPHGQPLLDVMNEAWRVLRRGGTFTAVLPSVGHTDPTTELPQPYHGWQPWADPTHVSWWWLPEAFLYFCDGPFKPHANYGISVWGQLGQHVPEDVATRELEWQRGSPAPRSPGMESFWSIRGGWEAVVRLVKP